MKTKSMIKFKDLPEEIQERMLDEQVRQGNNRDAEVFERDIATDSTTGGFDWDYSEEGFDFWDKILEGGNFSIFYEKYPKS